MQFSAYKYERPDVNTLLQKTEALCRALSAAENFAEADAVLARFHGEREIFSTAAQVAEIRFSQNVADPFYSAENEFMGGSRPLIEESGLRFYRALLASPFKDDFARKYGDIFIEKLTQQSLSADGRITKLMQEENALCAEFYSISAMSSIPFMGKNLPAEQLYPYKGHKDRAVRKAAYEAEGRYFLQYKDRLEDIFDRLVQNRTAQARALGYKDFSELGVLRMGRLGYGLKEIAAYRAAVKKYWVPAVAKIKELQRQRLGLDTLKGYDNLLYFPDYNPVPHGSAEDMLKACDTMMHALGKETGEMFEALLKNGMFDLDSRHGKAAGGYCGSVDALRLPFIFSNFNGTTMDVDVLIHESGHALAAYEAYKNSIVPELREASAEVCETHSTAMEMLSMPYHSLFFREDTDRYDLFLMERTLTYLPGGCAGDEFQTVVYQHPEMTKAERNALWKELTRTYTPHFADFDDIPLYSDGGDWLMEGQYFVNPFYLVDYGMARNLSLQLFLQSETEPEKAWERYISFVKLGGTESYIGAAQAAGLKLPFYEENIKNTIEKMLCWVERQNEKVLSGIRR